MKKLLLSFALAVFATSSMALGLGNDNPASGGTSINTNTNGNHNNNLNTASAMQGQIQGQFQGQATNVDVSNRISNDSRASAVSFAGGGAGGAGGQGGDARAFGGAGGTAVSGGGQGGSASSGGSTSGVNFEITSPKNTPSIFSGNVYPTAPCMGSSTIGGAGVGFGFTVGSSWKDDDCGIRETARSFASMQMADDAITVLCTSEYAKLAPSCVAKAAKKAEDDAKAAQQ